MAIIKAIKYKPGGNSTASSMAAVIRYCLQPHKTELTENVFCTSGVNCNPRFAYQEFMATKALFCKASGVFFYHYVQSFSVDEEITPEEVNAIGLAFAKEAWQGYEVLVATHRDVNHLHNHFIVNSVSHETGLKLRQNPKTLTELRALSDKICLAHGKSVLPPYEKSKVQGIANGEYRKAIQGDSWKFRLMSAIGKAMDISGTKEEFTQNMIRQGYGVEWSDTRMHIVYTCYCEPKNKDGKYKKSRDSKLHSEKYLKCKMEEEFYVREQLLCTTESRGTFEIEREKEAAYIANAARNNAANDRFVRKTVGADEHDNGRYSERESDPQRAICASSEYYFRNRADRNGKSTLGTAQGNRANDTETRESGGITGWESSRESWAAYRMARNYGQLSVGTESHRNGTPHRSGPGIGSLYGLASAVSIMDDDTEDAEEKRRRIEAEQYASNVGAVIGTAIGLVMSLSGEADEDEYDEKYDDGFGQTM